MDYIFKYGMLVLIFGSSIWFYTSSVTDGMLVNRYTNKNTMGKTQEDFTTGRVVILENEWNNFLENPFFGIGVGTGKFKRLEEINAAIPTHNEMSRLLGEHGVVGFIILLILITIPIINMGHQPYESRAFLTAFLIFWFLTINHSAMRLAMPAFVYGLGVMMITRPRIRKSLKPELE